MIRQGFLGQMVSLGLFNGYQIDLAVGRGKHDFTALCRGQGIGGDDIVLRQYLLHAVEGAGDDSGGDNRVFPIGFIHTHNDVVI